MGETKDPIHLTLDTTLTSGRVTMKAYVFVPLGVPGATSGSMFTPVQVELVASEPEIAGLDLLNKTKFSKVRTVEPMPELTKVADAAEKMQVMLDAVIQYVEAVLDVLRSRTTLLAGPLAIWCSPCPRWIQTSLK